jgi:hypothetical protein
VARPLLATLSSPHAAGQELPALVQEVLCRGRTERLDGADKGRQLTVHAVGVQTPGISDDQEACSGCGFGVAELELNRGKDGLALRAGTAVPVMTQGERSDSVVLSFSWLLQVSQRPGRMTREPALVKIKPVGIVRASVRQSLLSLSQRSSARPCLLSSRLCTGFHGGN